MPTTIAKDPTIESVFPNGVLRHERWGMLVNGLDQDVVPQGTLLGSAVNPNDSGRVFHMLDCNGERVKLGVFQALPGEEAPCYALILERAPINSRDADNMAYTYEQKIKEGLFLALPTTLPPTIDNANRFLADNVSPSGQALGL